MGLRCSQMLLFPVLPAIISGEKRWGEPSSWNRLTFMPVSSLWVIALDLGTVRFSQKLFRGLSVYEPASGVNAPFLLYLQSYMRQTELLSSPSPRPLPSAGLILFCLGPGNSFLFPFIWPLMHCCQSDVSAMHVGSSLSLSLLCQLSQIKPKLLSPAFWAFSTEFRNCFSRQASASPLTWAWPGVLIPPTWCSAPVGPSASVLSD